MTLFALAPEWNVFELDTWETNASIGAMNVMAFLSNILLVGFLIVMEPDNDE
jgi:hypothetical protein